MKFVVWRITDAEIGRDMCACIHNRFFNANCHVHEPFRLLSVKQILVAIQSLYTNIITKISRDKNFANGSHSLSTHVSACKKLALREKLCE